MRQFTIATLISKVRELTDDQNSQRISDTEIQQWLNTAYGELLELLVQSGHPWQYKVETISPGASPPDPYQFSVATDYMGTIGVDYKASAGPPVEWVSLQQMQYQDRNRFAGQGTTLTRAYGYIIVGGDGYTTAPKLELVPKPGATKEYRHIYVPQPPNISALETSTQIDVYLPSGEDFMIWGSARMAAIKEEANSEPYERNFERARQRVLESSRHRVVNAGGRSENDARLIRELATALRNKG